MACSWRKECCVPYVKPRHSMGHFHEGHFQSAGSKNEMSSGKTTAVLWKSSSTGVHLWDGLCCKKYHSNYSLYCFDMLSSQKLSLLHPQLLRRYQTWAHPQRCAFGKGPPFLWNQQISKVSKCHGNWGMIHIFFIQLLILGHFRGPVPPISGTTQHSKTRMISSNKPTSIHQWHSRKSWLSPLLSMVGTKTSGLLENLWINVLS